MRALIVDDHKVVRRGLTEIMEEGFPEAKTTGAGTSEEALQLIYAEEWEIVLLDINIPGRGGLEVLDEIKRVRPKLPVVVISGYAEDDLAMHAIKLGASAYLTKEVVADELILAVQRVLAGRRYITESLAQRMAESISGGRGGVAHESLSARELQVLRLVAVGRTLKVIAKELKLSEKTIATYRARIAKKLKLGSSVEIARYALQNRLVE